MTRLGKSSRDQTLSDLFAADAEAAMLHVLRDADAALTAGEVKKALYAGGVAKADADQAWPRFQKRIGLFDQVIVEGRGRYRWTTQPPVPSASEALELLIKGRLPANKKDSLTAIIRTALVSPSVDREMDSRRRQAEIDAVRALAELAIEVEELTANEASAGAMIHRVRARVKRAGLEPIDRAGEETTFDRKRHVPIDGQIGDGASVVVVRPGYVWKGPAEDVLIARAVVEE